MTSEANIFRGVTHTASGKHRVRLNGNVLCTVDDIEEAIKIRRKAERRNHIVITEGITKEYFGGPWSRVRGTVDPDGKLWLFAGDICESLGFNAPYYGNYADRIPGHMKGLVHINHGKRAYRVYSLEGVLVFLTYLNVYTEDFKQWLLAHIYPATVMESKDRLRMAHYLLETCIEEDTGYMKNFTTKDDDDA